MNIKASLMMALAACIMLVGVAAAESPDAGATWNSAHSFDMVSGYNNVDGQLAANQNPVDGVDWWCSDDVSSGSYLELYLDGDSLDDGAVGQMYKGDHTTLMQYVSKNTQEDNYYILGTVPVYVKISGVPPIPYTFVVYKN
jgi:hypothetical protein